MFPNIFHLFIYLYIFLLCAGEMLQLAARPHFLCVGNKLFHKKFKKRKEEDVVEWGRMAVEFVGNKCRYLSTVTAAIDSEMAAVSRRVQLESLWRIAGSWYRRREMARGTPRYLFLYLCLSVSVSLSLSLSIYLVEIERSGGALKLMALSESLLFIYFFCSESLKV